MPIWRYFEIGIQLAKCSPKILNKCLTKNIGGQNYVTNGKNKLAQPG